MIIMVAPKRRNLLIRVGIDLIDKPKPIGSEGSSDNPQLVQERPFGPLSKRVLIPWQRRNSRHSSSTLGPTDDKVMNKDERANYKSPT
jgi:hypothetical protein